MAQLLVLRSLPQLHLVRVGVHRLEHRLGHFLLPTLGNHQGKVLVELLVAIQQLAGRERGEDSLPEPSPDLQATRSSSAAHPGANHHTSPQEAPWPSTVFIPPRKAEVVADAQCRPSLFLSWPCALGDAPKQAAEICRRGLPPAHLDSLRVLFVEGADVESICCVDFSPGGNQGRGVLAKQGEQRYKGKPGPLSIGPQELQHKPGLSNRVQIRQSRITPGLTFCR